MKKVIASRPNDNDIHKSILITVQCLVYFDSFEAKNISVLIHASLSYTLGGTTILQRQYNKYLVSIIKLLIYINQYSRSNVYLFLSALQ